MKFYNHDTETGYPQRASYLLDNGANLQIKGDRITITSSRINNPDNVIFSQAGYFYSRGGIDSLIEALEHLKREKFNG